MKIAIVSDTHGFWESLVEPIKKASCDLLFHLGDHYEDGILLARETALPFYGVKGNNDLGMEGPYENWVQVEGYLFYLTHGHRQGVYGGREGLLPYLEKADGVFYGHTHRYDEIRLGNKLIVNPGSPTYPRASKASFALLNLEENLSVERILMEPSSFSFF